MPDPTYVNVATIGVKESFDNKYKSSAPKAVNAALEKAINRSSKLTTDPPKDKKAEGFYLDGSISLKKTAKGIEATLSMAMATWPKKSIFATASSSASLDDATDKTMDKDVEALIKGLLDDVVPKVIKELEKRAK